MLRKQWSFALQRGGMAGGVRSAKLGFVVWLCFSTLGAALGGKVLAVPVDGSHWLSMKLLVQELVVRGHEVVLLVPATSMLIQGSAGCRTEIYPVSYTKEDLDNTLKQLKDDVFLKQPRITDVFVNFRRLIDFTSIHVKGCESLLYNREAMGRLRGEGFDMVLTDPFLPCGSILAETLSVPIVYFLRGLPCGLEEAATQCPAPPSYVPRFFSGKGDNMTFPQRVKNTILYMTESVICRIVYSRYDELASRYLEKDITYNDLLSDGAVWLLRYDFAFLFPRPLMPNMVLIGGINCVKPAPLPADLQEFVDGSGDDGFIVFTLGSAVDKMPAELTKVFLDAFSKIRQRVVWRHAGILPDDVPEKVKIMKWLPQNDLLAHPKAKLFLTHGGSHGVYEGICHAVPMVMMPLFGDQPDNVDYMVARGVAVMVAAFDVTTEKLLEAFNKVLHDTRGMVGPLPDPSMFLITEVYAKFSIKDTPLVTTMNMGRDKPHVESAFGLVQEGSFLSYQQPALTYRYTTLHHEPPPTLHMPLESYKEKMVKLSAVHQDHAVEPLDLAVFWTEFVMRHKGADHLRPAAHHLNLIQYHSLDTVCFLAAILMTIAFLALKCSLFCARKCGVMVKKKKE